MTEQTLLVGDAGGTNVRFALAHVAEGRVALSQVWKRPGADFESFGEALSAFLAEMKPSCTGVSLGLAGQERDGQVELLNRGWTVDLAEVRKLAGVDRLVA